MPSETTYDFAGKYTAEGRIGRWLVDRFYSSLGDILVRCAPTRCIEVGCGEGFSSERIRRLAGPHVQFAALDVEPRLVRAARLRNPGVPFCLGSIYALPFPDDAADTVLALEVLEHLESPLDALAELRRVAARWIVLSVPREPLWRILNLARLRYARSLGNTPGHRNHWSRSSFVAFAGAAGAVREVRSPVPWTQVLVELA
ncbi:MAG: class I SAM-dependent methyltransferase [Deltaproteobacteria bacterium]|nr:class I SAM-dependent methyltransferase [Deltaproteobacteria bacterium]